LEAGKMVGVGAWSAGRIILDGIFGPFWAPKRTGEFNAIALTDNLWSISFFKLKTYL